MIASKKYDVELMFDQYDALMRNSLILSICGDMLKSRRKRQDCFVLRLTRAELEELTGFVAAEANHADTRYEEQALGDLYEHLEAVLSSIHVESDQ